jgi:hypothetical protein
MKITKKQLKRIIKEERAKLLREEKRRLAEQPISGEQAIQMQRDQDKPGIARAKTKKVINAGEQIWFALSSIIDQALDQARDGDDMRQLADDLRGYADDVEDSIPEGE